MKRELTGTTGTSFQETGMVDSPWTVIEQLRLELASVKAKSDERKEMLKRIQWVEGGEWEYYFVRCPLCGSKYDYKEIDDADLLHMPDCLIVKALED